jgi:DNA-binding beta-propeller fold protein YncE
LCLILAVLVPALSAQLPPAPNTTVTNYNFGSVVVGSTSSPATVTVTFVVADTLSSISVVTQGAPNLDFKAASSGATCSAGSAYTVNATCSIAVTFAPHAAGTHYGAVVLTDANNAVIGTGFLQGSGSGPQTIFSPGVQSFVVTGLPSVPSGIAVDAAFSLYIAYGAQVYKLTPGTGGYTQTQIGSGFGHPQGIALDGAGNIYISDTASGGNVYLESLTRGAYVQTTVSTGDFAYGIAVDGNGNLYLADGNANAVYKDTRTASGYTKTTVASGMYPRGVAVDAGGDIFISPVNSASIYKETPSNGIYAQTAFGSVSSPQALAMDAAGNVYAADSGNGRIVKETLLGGQYVQSVVVGSLASPQGVAVDSAGNVYMSDTNNSRVLEINQSAPPALTFANATYGSTSTDSPRAMLVGNMGTATLNFTAIQYPADFPESAAGSADCTTTTPLTGGESCTLTINFSPLAPVTNKNAIVLSENVVIKTNDLNVAGTAQQVPVSGTETGALPNVTLSSSANPARVGTPVTFTANIGGPAALPTGTVQFLTRYTILGSSAVTNGVAAYTTSSLGVGNYSITAVYSGDQYYTSANSSPLSQVIAKPSPPLTLATSANPSAAGVAVTFTATLGSVGSSGVPAGSVTFLAGSTPLGTIALSSGVAKFTTSLLSMGTYVITAAYSGSVVYAPVTSTPISESIGVPNFSSISLGTTATAAIPVTMLYTGTVSSIQVLTQGVTGLDFKIATGGTCAANVAYSVAAVCTVQVTFAPRYTGTRYGAIQIVDTDGDLIATSYLQGSGWGPQAVFAPPDQTPIGVGWLDPDGVIADGNGSLYVADAGTGDIYKESLRNGVWVETTIASGLNTPRGVAVDGAGNVFVADSSGHVYEEALLNSKYSESTVLSPYIPQAVAVDGSGNLYIAAYSSVIKLAPSGSGYVTSATLGFTSPHGVAVDAAGNLYVADSGADALYQETYINGGYQQSILVTHHSPVGVAVDGTGNVFLAVESTSTAGSAPNGAVYKETPLEGAFTESSVGNGWSNPTGVAVDGAGVIYVSDSGLPAVIEEDAANPPTLNFASTSQGSFSTDSPQTITVSNLGGAPLNFSAITYPTDFPHAKTGVNDCSATTSLVHGWSCPLTVSFFPVTAVGSNSSIELSEMVTVTTNTANVASTTQAATVNGKETGVAWTVKLTASATTVTVGTPITFTATITAVGGGTPTGSVAFYSGNSLLVSSALSGSTAIAIVSSIPVGAHTITAVFTDTNSNAIGLTINKTTTTAIVAASTPTAVLGNPVRFRVSLAGTPNVDPPSGFATFYAGSSKMGTAMLKNGVATFASGALKPGVNTIRVLYSGDTNYFAAASNFVTVTVSRPAAATPRFSRASGTYTTAIEVAIATATPGATIYYTRDGSVPTNRSATYKGPFTVSASQTVKAIAIANGYSGSAVAGAAYTIRSPAPVPQSSR